MDSVIQTLSVEEIQQRDALAGRLFQSMLGALDLFHVYLGSHLGLYDALRVRGWATSAELALATQLSERYVREWLEQQAVSGILDVQEMGADAHSRCYTLSPGHAEVLLERNSLNYGAPFPREIVSVASQLPAVARAFRNGGGVPYEEYGTDMREGIADTNRVFFLNLLGSNWFPAIPDVHARLQTDPSARVADVGCGSGWSSIAIARAYPKVHVEGFDIDGPSVALAQANAAAEGLADRVNFSMRDAADPALEGTFDLVVATASYLWHGGKWLRPWSKGFPGTRRPSALGLRSVNPRPIGYVSACVKVASKRYMKAEMDNLSNCEAKYGSFWKRRAGKLLTLRAMRSKHNWLSVFPSLSASVKSTEFVRRWESAIHPKARKKSGESSHAAGMARGRWRAAVDFPLPTKQHFSPR